MKTLPKAFRLLLFALAAFLPGWGGVAAAPLEINAAAAASAAPDSSGHRLWTSRSSAYRAGSWLSGVAGLDPTLDSSVSDVVFEAGGGISLFASAQPGAALRNAPTVPWCAEASGLLRIGSLGQECLMHGTLQLELPGQVGTAEVGVNAQGRRWDLGLSYGQSWLNESVSPWLSYAGSAVSRLPLATVAPAYLGRLEGRGLAIGGQWRLTEASALRLNAAINQLRLHDNPIAAPISFDRTEIGLGMVFGTLSGMLIGHTQSHIQTGPQLGSLPLPAFSGLDVGISWRTPWRAELSVGARNVISNGDPVLLPAPQANVIDAGAARTPYVRYKQDL